MRGSFGAMKREVGKKLKCLQYSNNKISLSLSPPFFYGGGG